MEASGSNILLNSLDLRAIVRSNSSSTHLGHLGNLLLYVSSGVLRRALVCQLYQIRFKSIQQCRLQVIVLHFRTPRKIRRQSNHLILPTTSKWVAKFAHFCLFSWFSIRRQLKDSIHGGECLGVTGNCCLQEMDNACSSDEISLPLAFITHDHHRACHLFVS